MNTQIPALPAGVIPLTLQEERDIIGGWPPLAAIVGGALLVSGVIVALVVGAAVIGGVVYALNH